MPKYLMIDQGGVLEGDCIESLANTTPNDLIISKIEEDENLKGFRVLKNGIPIVQHLNRLVIQYGYKILYHSANALESQIKLHQNITTACAKQNLPFPFVHVMAILNKTCTAPDITLDLSPIPLLGNARSIIVVEFSKDEAAKRSIRKAFQNALRISFSDIAQSHVLDDELSVITAARGEGYIGHHINHEETLEHALQKIIDIEVRHTKSNEQKNPPTVQEEASLSTEPAKSKLMIK